MTPSKAKGSLFESSLVPLLQGFYPSAERRVTSGANDRGDFNLPGEKRFIIEAKNCARMDLAGWMAEAEREARNAQVPIGVVAHKRRGKTDPGAQWVTLKAFDFLQLVAPGLPPVSGVGGFQDAYVSGPIA